jgi:hypothetical protein
VNENGIQMTVFNKRVPMFPWEQSWIWLTGQFYAGRGLGRETFENNELLFRL